MKKVEDAIQKEIVKWIRKEYPEVDLRMNNLDGNKNMIQAMQDKRRGQAIKGTPDLTLFIHKEDYTHILELELKTKKGSLNTNQEEWWSEFRPNQNRVGEVGYGLADTQEKIQKWINSIKN